MNYTEYIITPKDIWHVIKNLTWIQISLALVGLLVSFGLMNFTSLGTDVSLFLGIIIFCLAIRLDARITFGSAIACFFVIFILNFTRKESLTDTNSLANNIAVWGFLLMILGVILLIEELIFPKEIPPKIKQFANDSPSTQKDIELSEINDIDLSDFETPNPRTIPLTPKPNSTPVVTSSNQANSSNKPIPPKVASPIQNNIISSKVIETPQSPKTTPLPHLNRYVPQKNIPKPVIPSGITLSVKPKVVKIAISSQDESPPPKAAPLSDKIVQKPKPKVTITIKEEPNSRPRFSHEVQLPQPEPVVVDEIKTEDPEIITTPVKKKRRRRKVRPLSMKKKQRIINM